MTVLYSSLLRHIKRKVGGTDQKYQERKNGWDRNDKWPSFAGM